MRKTPIILTGVFAPLFYFFVFNLMVYWVYNENSAHIPNAALFILPMLPGIALAFLLIRNSLREFFKSFGICFLVSISTFLIYKMFGIDLWIYTQITGYDEFSLGEGLLLSVTFIPYIVSCFAGTIIAGVVTLCKQIQANKK